MEKIPLDSLQPETIAPVDFLSPKGDILITKGSKISDFHISLLKRRHVKLLYINKPSDELKNLLSYNVDAVQTLEKEFSIDDYSAELDDLEDIQNLDSSIKNNAPGQKGLQEILSSKFVEKAEKKIKDFSSFPVKPEGEALERNIKEVGVTQRTVDYKKAIYQEYEDALLQTIKIYSAFADKKSVPAPYIGHIIENFVDTFITDKNILLNLANIRPKEDYLFNHALNVSLLSINIAASAGYNHRQVVEIGMCSLLQDVGMMLIPRQIRFNKERLSKDEFYEIQKHPVIGMHILETITGLPDSVPYASYLHHEREKGTGYPKQRHSRFIHNFTKITSIADVYEALISPRAWRKPYLPYQGIEMVLKLVREGFFNGEYVKSLIDYTSLFPVGSLVRLNSGEIAKVVKANKSSYTKPVVSILMNNQSEMLKEEKIRLVDLLQTNGLSILEPVDNENLQVDLMKGF